mmetsp:Transcript_2424/g.8175  ORF Transcript_2424/g.8175 Transcript_2424/m.8175 type:complete len:222 (+) Transcript_2424:508-1173(+)
MSACLIDTVTASSCPDLLLPYTEVLLVTTEVRKTEFGMKTGPAGHCSLVMNHPTLSTKPSKLPLESAMRSFLLKGVVVFRTSPPKRLLTTCWAAKPTARPATPPKVSRGFSGTPSWSREKMKLAIQMIGVRTLSATTYAFAVAALDIRGLSLPVTSTSLALAIWSLAALLSALLFQLFSALAAYSVTKRLGRIARKLSPAVAAETGTISYSRGPFAAESST